MKITILHDQNIMENCQKTLQIVADRMLAVNEIFTPEQINNFVSQVARILYTASQTDTVPTDIHQNMMQYIFTPNRLLLIDEVSQKTIDAHHLYQESLFFQKFAYFYYLSLQYGITEYQKTVGFREELLSQKFIPTIQLAIALLALIQFEQFPIPSNEQSMARLFTTASLTGYFLGETLAHFTIWNWMSTAK